MTDEVLTCHVCGVSGTNHCGHARCPLPKFTFDPASKVNGDDPRVEAVARCMIRKEPDLPWDEWRRTWPATAEKAVELVAASDAVDPLRQTVSGDRVEAAFDAYWSEMHGDVPWREAGSPAERRLKKAISRALSAADRGRAVMDWRRSEEYTQGDGYILARYRTSRSDEAICEFTLSVSRTMSLAEDVIAWAEMPAPPAWAAENSELVAGTTSAGQVGATDESHPKHLRSGETGRTSSPPDNGAVFTWEMREFIVRLSRSVEMLLFDVGKNVDAEDLQSSRRTALTPAATWPPEKTDD